MGKTEFAVRYHELYWRRVEELKARVKELKGKLPPEEFRSHEVVKLAWRVREAEREVAEDPDRPEHLLHGELRKFRRYKRGLGRYRLFYCFSRKPPVVLFLYLNTEKSLRKEGDRRDPYEEFKTLLRRGVVSKDAIGRL